MGRQGEGGGPRNLKLAETSFMDVFVVEIVFTLLCGNVHLLRRARNAYSRVRNQENHKKGRLKLSKKVPYVISEGSLTNLAL